MTRSTPDRARRLAAPLVRYRYVVWAAILAWTALLDPREHDDWHYYREGADALFSAHGLHLYADHPTVQIGVVGLAAARALDALAGSHAAVVAQILATAAALPTAWLVERASVRTTTTGRVLGGGVMMLVWTQASVLGQFGDCLLLALLVAAVLAIRDGRGLTTGILIGLAVATKPWAAPALLMPLSLTGRSRWRALAVAVGATTAAYLPFVIADTDTWSASRPPFRTSPATIGGLLGWVVAPGWVRIVQLAIGLALGAIAVVRLRYAAIPLLLVIARLSIEPNAASYYVLGLAVTAWLWDEQRNAHYVSSILTLIYFFVPQGAQPTAVVTVKLTLLATLGLVALVGRADAPARRS